MFEGFPRRVRFVPVPSPVFGPLLEQIDDLAELKCMLRVIWLLHEKKGYPRYVTLKELLADRTLVTALADDGSPSAVEYLLWASRDTRLRGPALQSLASLSNPAAIPFLDTLLNEHTDPALLEALRTSLSRGIEAEKAQELLARIELLERGS